MDHCATAPPAAPESAPWRRGFWCLMFAQFQNAFSDSALRWLVTFLVLGLGLPRAEEDHFVALIGAVFALPFLLFSSAGGWLADRYSKRAVMIGVKTAELGIMLCATAVLATGPLALQIAVVSLMGLHSTIFAPSKYGIMPELLPLRRLSWGNGMLELLTFLGIIAGTTAGGWLAEHFTGRQYLSGLILSVVAITGLIASLGVTRVPAAAPDKPFEWNFVRALWRQFGAMRADRDLWRANWGNAGFFFVCALLQMNLTLHAKQAFHLQPSEQAWLQAALSLGIGAGSALAGSASRGRIEYGLLPLGTVLFGLMCAVIGWPGLPRVPFIAALAFLGLGAGLFIVPVAAVLQHRPLPGDKGAVQGAASWLSWVGIVLASIVQSLLGSTLHLPHTAIFWICGACAAAGGAYVAKSRPGATRAFLRSLTRPWDAAT